MCMVGKRFHMGFQIPAPSASPVLMGGWGGWYCPASNSRVLSIIPGPSAGSSAKG